MRVGGEHMRVSLPMAAAIARCAADGESPVFWRYAGRFASATIGAGQGTRLQLANRSASALSPKTGRSTVSPERPPQLGGAVLPSRKITSTQGFADFGHLGKNLWSQRPERLCLVSEQITPNPEAPRCKSPSRGCVPQSPSRWFSWRLPSRAAATGRPSAWRPVARCVTSPATCPAAASTRHAADGRSLACRAGLSWQLPAHWKKVNGTFLALAAFACVTNVETVARAADRNREDTSCEFLPLPLRQHPRSALRLAKAPTSSVASWAQASARQPRRQPAATWRQARPSAARLASCVTTSPRSSATDTAFDAQPGLTRPSASFELMNAVRTGRPGGVCRVQSARPRTMRKTEGTTDV